MKKVKIIAGAYGQHIGSRVFLRDVNSEPFELDEAEANRLADLGVAEIVEIVERQPPADRTSDHGDKISDDDNDDVDGVDENNLPFYSVDSSAADLREIGKTCGLSFRVGMSKADMVAALDEYFGSLEPSPNTSLSASDPI